MVPRYNIFLSHAGREKKDIMDLVYGHIVHRGGVYDKQRAFLDEHSLEPGTQYSWELILEVARTCDAAVIVLSTHFVCKPDPMAELELLVKRKREDPGFILLPVFLDISVEACSDLGTWYTNNPWPCGLPPVEQGTLRHWANLVKELPRHTGCRLDQCGGYYGELAAQVANAAVTCLVNAGKLPPALLDASRPIELGRVLLQRDSQHPVMGRQAEIQAIMDGLRSPAGAVVVMGPPGEGKTTVSVQAGLELCWNGWFPGGAFPIDLSGFKPEITVADFFATQLALVLQEAKGLPKGPDGSSWSLIKYWLTHDADGAVLLVLENADEVLKDSVAAMELAKLLREVQSITGRSGERRVRLVVNSRGRVTMHLDGARRVHLGRLAEEAARQLLQVHSGLDAEWRQTSVAAQLVAMCDCNPLALKIMGNLILRGRLTAEEAVQRYATSRKFTRLGSVNVKVEARELLEGNRVTLKWFISLLTAEEQAAVASLSLFPGSIDAAAACAVLRGAWPSFVAGPGAVPVPPAEADAVQQLLRTLHKLAFLEQQQPGIGHTLHIPSGTAAAAPAAPPRYKMHLLLRELASDLHDTLRQERLQAKHARLLHDCWHYLHMAVLAAVIVGHWRVAAGFVMGALLVCLVAAKSCRLAGLELDLSAEKWMCFWMLHHPAGPGQQLRQLCLSDDMAACQAIVADDAANLLEAVRVMGVVLGGLDGHVASLDRQAIHRTVLEFFQVFVKVLDAPGGKGRIVTFLQAKMDTVDLMARMVGAKHVHTLRAKQGLAAALHEGGEWEQARLVYEEVLFASHEAPLWQSHDTVGCMMGLIDVLMSLGNISTLQQLPVELDRDKRKGLQKLKAFHAQYVCSFGHSEVSKLDPPNINRIKAEQDLAQAMVQLGELADAQLVLERVVDDYDRLSGQLGQDHLRMIEAMLELAKILVVGGQLERAVELIRKAIPSLAREFGDKSASTMVAQHQLAGALLLLGRPGEALGLAEEVLQATTGVLFPTHMLVAKARHTVARAHAALGNLDAAKGLLERVVAVYAEVVPSRRSRHC